MKKNASKSNSSKTVANLRKAQDAQMAAKLSGPSLKDLVSGKGDAVAKATASHAAKQLASAPKKGAKKAVAAKKASKASEPRVTVASFIRALIIEGKENTDIFEAAVKRFGIGEDKKHYPSWYRSELKRKPELRETAAK